MFRTATLLFTAALAISGCTTSHMTALPGSTGEVVFDGEQPDRGQIDYIESATHLMIDGADHSPAAVARAARLGLRSAGFEIVQDITTGDGGQVIGKDPLAPLNREATAGVYFRKAPGGMQVKSMVANADDVMLAHKANETIMNELQAHWQFWSGNDKKRGR